MTLITRDHSIATRILDGKASRQVLSAAVRDKSAIHLRADSECDDKQLQGVIIDDRDGQLSIDLSPPGHRTHTVIISPVLYATLDVAEKRYVFKTRCLTVGADANADVLRLTSPAAIAVVERRRASRHRLREPTDVILRASDSDSSWQCKAVLLNLSVDGMACRIDITQREAWALTVGDTVCTTFSVGDENQSIDLTARIATRTEAATPEHVILGTEFVEDGNLTINKSRLRKACAEPG